eukprot:PhM_4_TR11678/c0_g1_i2/m.13307
MSSTSTTSPIPSNAPNSVPYFVSPEMGQAQQPQVLHQQQQQPVFIFPSAGVAGDPNIAMQPQQQQPMFFVVNGPNGTLLPLQQGFMMPDGAAAAQPYFQASPMVAQHQHQQQPAVMVMMPQQQEQSPPQAQVAKADDDAKTAGELSKHHSSHSLLSTGHEQRPRRVASAGQAQLRDGISPQRSVRRQSLSHNQLPIPRQKLKIDSGLKLRCFYCRDVGHKAIHCPMNPEWSGELSALCVLHNKTRCMSSLRPHGDPSLGQYECLPDSACRRVTQPTQHSCRNPSNVPMVSVPQPNVIHPSYRQNQCVPAQTFPSISCTPSVAPMPCWSSTTTFRTLSSTTSIPRCRRRRPIPTLPSV